MQRTEILDVVKLTHEPTIRLDRRRSRHRLQMVSNQKLKVAR
jgi:hypothetical protein